MKNNIVLRQQNIIILYIIYLLNDYDNNNNNNNNNIFIFFLLIQLKVNIIQNYLPKSKALRRELRVVICFLKYIKVLNLNRSCLYTSEIFWPFDFCFEIIIIKED